MGLNLARRMGATHAILTGKADPLQERGFYLGKLIDDCRQHLPLVDLHTNGLRLHQKPDMLKELRASGLTMITFSVSSFNEATNNHLMGIDQKPKELIKMARDLGLLVRCSLVVNKQGVANLDSIADYIYTAGEFGAHMVVVREIWIPETKHATNSEVFNWNLANRILIDPIQDQFIKAAQVGRDNKNQLLAGLQQRDPLPWGTPVFAMSGVFTDPDHGVNVTFAICDEATTGPILKSIVHKPNGRGYRGWDCPGDYLY